MTGAPKRRTADVTRLRRAMIVVHRYVGLTIASFLVVAGLTGSLIAFKDELDGVFAARLLHVVPPPGGKMLDPFELQRRIQAQLPTGQSHRRVDLVAKPDMSTAFFVEVREDEYRQFFANPYTGALIGSRKWGDLREGWVNVVPFVYTLHYSLALGEVGMVLFGIAALLWTVDCFVGAYITFPPPRERSEGAAKSKSWLARWAPSWLIRTTKLFSFAFTFHRAAGLWVWGLLLVFAWSGVALNLREQLYRPLMRAIALSPDGAHQDLPHLKPPYPEPRLDLEDAQRVGRELVAAQAKLRGFTVGREVSVDYGEDHGVYFYEVETSLDISREHGATSVFIDGQDGSFRGLDASTGIGAGVTITSWLYALHMAKVWGLPYRIAVCLLGLVVTGLSVTGVWIWLRKRSKRPRRAS